MNLLKLVSIAFFREVMDKNGYLKCKFQEIGEEAATSPCCDNGSGCRGGRLVPADRHTPILKGATKGKIGEHQIMKKELKFEINFINT